MKYSLLLRKGNVVEVISKTEFLVEDVLNKEIINMTVPLKFRMNYFKIEVGEEVYITVSPFEQNRGRITLLSSFKMDNELYVQKTEIDKKHDDLKN